MTFEDYMEMTKNEEPSTYVSIKACKETKRKIADFMKENKIEGKTTTLHSSVVSVPKKIPFIPVVPNMPLKAKFKRWVVWDTNKKGTGKCLVAEIESPELLEWHKALNEKYSSVHDYREYIPHITLNYDWEGPLPESQIDFDIIFDSYTVNIMRNEWKI